MTRRDRAAMALALEALRYYDRHTLLALRTATRALEAPMCRLHWIALALHSARYQSDESANASERKLRARLALLLRALLRADGALDVAGPRRRWCRRRLRGEPCTCWGGRVRALHEAAPAHDGRTPRERRAEMERSR